MIDATTVFISLVFLAAGAVKGVIGLGLPAVAMAMLALIMSPLKAAAILMLPSLVTNIWQMTTGPALGSLVRRLWPILIGICLGTWAGVGSMTGAAAHYGPALLGVALSAYALTGLFALRIVVRPAWQPLLSPVIGAATGLIASATGVYAVPVVPYLQALGLEKDELVQALGLTFTTATVALCFNIAAEGGLSSAASTDSLIALVFTCGGLWFGQAIRTAMSPDVFRRWFLIGMLVQGIYLSLRAAF